VGVRGRSAGRRPAGHVAQELLTRITKPLLVVPPGARAPTSFGRLVVPLDGTTATAAGAQGLIDLVNGGVEVIVIHVCDEDRIPAFTDQPQHETLAFAKEFVARYAPGTRAQLELRVGVPADEILAAAVAVDADLCVLGWAQSIEPGRAPVIKELLARSPIPLLLLPLATRSESPARG